jgi:MFS family permease
MGYMGAVMGLATVSGPLLGGVITDTSWLGWRWCFYVGVPFAAVAVVLLQKTLHLPPRPKRVVTIDYLGAVLITAGVSCLLIWVSLAGQNFAWGSWQTAVMVVGGLVLLALAVLVESRATEPIIPLALFRNRTVVLAIVASVAVGVALFGTTVFLTQYMQIGRGKSATVSGLLTFPMMVGMIGSSTVVGRIITRTGFYKRYMLVGAVLLPVGLALMGTIHYDTSLLLIGGYMLVLGAGVGMLMQNLVLAVQNVVPARELGAASSNVAFFRTMGGAIGVSALGALLGNRIATLLPVGPRRRQGAAARDPAPATHHTNRGGELVRRRDRRGFPCRCAHRAHRPGRRDLSQGGAVVHPDRRAAAGRGGRHGRGDASG